MNKFIVLGILLLSSIFLYYLYGGNEEKLLEPDMQQNVMSKTISKQETVPLVVTNVNKKVTSELQNVEQETNDKMDPNESAYTTQKPVANLEDNPSNALIEEFSKEEEAQIAKAFKDIYESIANKNWDALIKNAETFPIDELEDKFMLTFALTQAIANGAPLEVLVSLLNRGAELNSEILFVAAVRQDVTIIKTLVEYGLNLHSSDRQGRNALHYALSNLNDTSNASMFEYFISNGVSTSIPDPEKDLISSVLVACSYSNNVGHFIQRLLFLGEKILPYHRQKYNQLALENSLCVRQISQYFK